MNKIEAISYAQVALKGLKEFEVPIPPGYLSGEFTTFFIFFTYFNISYFTKN